MFAKFLVINFFNTFTWTPKCKTLLRILFNYKFNKIVRSVLHFKVSVKVFQNLTILGPLFYIKTLVTHDLNVQFEILKLLYKICKIWSHIFYQLILFYALLKNLIWPKTTENMKITPKQVIFFCAQNTNPG